MSSTNEVSRDHQRDIQFLYKIAKEKHSELVSVEASHLLKLEEEFRRKFRQRLTLDFIAIATLISLASVVVIVCVITMWSMTKRLSARLITYDYQTIIAGVPGLKIGLSMGLLAIFTYFLFMPLTGGKRVRRGSLVDEIIWSDKRFVVVAIVLLYFAVGTTAVLIASTVRVSQNVLDKLFRTFLIPPGVILSLTPLGIVFLGPLILRHFRSKKATNEAEICEQLLRQLGDWPTSDLENISSEIKRKIAQRLRITAGLIQRLYFKVPPQDRSEEWAADQMKRAADNLLVCTSWLYVPQAGTIESVRLRIVRYCNAFLTDCLHDLPRDVLTEEQGLKTPIRRQRVRRTISFVIAVLTYCLAPVIVYFVLGDRLPRLTVPDSLLLLLYSLWIAIGLYGYLEQTSDNPSATILELVKGVIGR